MYKIISGIFLYTSLVLVLVTALDIYSAGASLITATRTSTRTSTRTPTHTPAKPIGTSTPFTDSFYKLLSWGAGGGGPNDPGIGNGEECFSQDYPKSTPAVQVIGADAARDYGYLCLFGFKPDEQITITFKSPNGKGDAVGIFTVIAVAGDTKSYFVHQISPSIGDFLAGEMEYLYENGKYDKQKLIAFITFWKPIGVPEGVWDVSIKSKSVNLKTSMKVGWSGTEPRFSWVYPQSSILSRAPFIPTTTLGAACQVANSNEKRIIQAINLKPNQSYPVGVYLVGKNTGNMNHSLTLDNESTIFTDKSGKYQTDFFAPQKNSPATYILALLRPESEVVAVLAKFGSLQLQDATYTWDCIQVKWKACPNAPFSGLEKGMTVDINPLNLIPNFIRNKPGLTSKLIGKMQIDESADVVDGPQCADNMVWWKIKTISGITGWAGEGQGSEVWMTGSP
jgi:hypothetical protein